MQPPLDDEPKPDAPPAQDAEADGVRQTLALIAVAVLLGGVALLMHGAGSVMKVLGGAVMVNLGVLAVADCARSYVRKRRRLPAEDHGLATKVIVYPIVLILTLVAILAPLAVLAKAVLMLMKK
jgi:hypothetical protein